jgi:5'-nucleotidase/UDP-sugar diphosphatase
MKSFATIALIGIATAALTGCAGSSSSSHKSARGNDVLDVQPTAAATPAKQAPYVGPTPTDPMAPADNISYPAAPVASATPASYTAAPANGSATGNIYKVKAGDTLFGIARTTYGDGKAWTRIASANPGLSPKSLKAGQTITLP